MPPLPIYSRDEVVKQRWVHLSLCFEGKNVVSSSLPFGSELTLYLRCDKRLSPTNAKLLLLYDKKHEWRTILPFSLEYTHTDTIAVFKLSPSQWCAGDGFGLFFYRFSIDTPWGEFYTRRRDRFEDKKNSSSSAFGNAVYEIPLLISESTDAYDEILHPLTVYSSIRKGAKRLEGAVIYHVFVDRFARGKRIYHREGTPYESDWENGIPEFSLKPGDSFPNNTHFGGSIEGIIDHLDYIRALGADYIYLSPIFKAYSNHKYDTGDYLQVDELFGGERALVELIEEAAERDIQIILDGVFNHTGDDSVYFNKRDTYPSVGAFQSPDSPYFSWYSFKDYPHSYECWWGVQCLPMIRKDCKEFWHFIAGDGGVIEKYAKMGIAGFRLDVVDELSRPFLSCIRDKLLETDEGNCLIGEVWEDASIKVAYSERRSYFSSLDLDGVIAYPFRRAIIDFCMGVSTSSVGNAITRIFENYPHHALLSSMNVLSTHDTERIVTLLGEPSCTQMTNTELSTHRLSEEKRTLAVQLQKIAAVMQFTLPGAPTIYYGDETAMEGGRDPFNRRCYPWGQEDGELIAFYRLLAKIHNESLPLKSGDASVLYADNGVLIYRRSLNGKRMLVLLNSSDKEVACPFQGLSGKEAISGIFLDEIAHLGAHSYLILEQ